MFPPVWVLLLMTLYIFGAAGVGAWLGWTGIANGLRWRRGDKTGHRARKAVIQGVMALILGYSLIWLSAAGKYHLAPFFFFTPATVLGLTALALGMPWRRSLSILCVCRLRRDPLCNHSLSSD